MVGDKLVTLDGLKAVYQELNGNTNDLKSAVIGSDLWEHPVAGAFTPGKYAPNNGSTGTGAETISVNGTNKSCYGVRTSYIDTKLTSAIRTEGDVYIFLLGTNDGTYQGWWDGNGFVKTGYAANHNTIDMDALAKNYPTYTFKAVAFDTSVTTQPDASDVCKEIYFMNRDRGLIDNLYLPDENYVKPEMTRAYYIGPNSGTDTSNSRYVRSELFDPGKYVAVGINSNDYSLAVAEYGNDADISDGTGFLGMSTYYTDKKVIISNDAKKIVINVTRKDNDTMGNTEHNTIRNLLVFYRIPLDTTSLKTELPCDNIIRDGGFCKILKTIGVVGDSLSSGSMHDPDTGASTGGEDETVVDKIWYSWIQQMARYTGSTAHNFSMGGLAARGLRYEQSNENVAQILTSLADSNNKCNAYFIALGHNDKTYMTNHSEYTVGTAADIDTSNPENNANTYCGNIGWVISKIKSYAPSAKIFLITMKAEGTFGTLNEALRTIPDVFNTSGTRTVYLLDMGTYAPRIESSWEYLNGHGSPQGYLNYSWQVSSYVDWYIRHYPNEFKLTAFYQ